MRGTPDRVHGRAGDRTIEDEERDVANAQLPEHLADPAAVRDLANKDAEIRKRQQQREEDSTKQEKNLADANLRRTQCQQALGRNKSLKDDANVYRYNEKGERVYLNAAMREESIAQNQKLMRDLGCTPGIQP